MSVIRCEATGSFSRVMPRHREPAWPGPWVDHGPQPNRKV